MREEDGGGFSFAQPRGGLPGSGNLPPAVTKVIDLGAVGLGDGSPALTEVAGRDDQDGLARRAEVRDRRLHRAGARAPEEQHFLLRAENLPQAAEALRVELLVVRAAVVNDRL